MLHNITFTSFTRFGSSVSSVVRNVSRSRSISTLNQNNNSYFLKSGTTQLQSSRNCMSSILKLGRLNHVAIATPNLETTANMYRDVLGAEVSEPEDLPSHGVTTIFINLGNTKIELLHPLGEKSPVQKFLNKHKDGGIHHICVEVKDIYAAVESINAGGQLRILDPEPKIGAHGKPVVFLHPKDCGGVLIELEQE